MHSNRPRTLRNRDIVFSWSYFLRYAGYLWHNAEEFRDDG